MKTLTKEIGNNRKIYLLLLFIFILGLFFRFYNFPYRYSLGGDIGRDVIMARTAAKDFQLPLTGSFSSLAPVTFGPWYYYLLILSHYFIPSVWAPYIVIGLFSLSMIIIMFLVGKIIIDHKLGLILASITALSPPQIGTATAISQHSLVGHFTAYAILLFLLLLKKKTGFILPILLGFVIGININMHYQALSFIILPIFFLLYREKWHYLPFIFAGGVLSFIPLMFFELNNHWFNVNNIIRYIKYDQYKIWTSNRWLIYLNDFWPNYYSLVLGVPKVGSIIIIFSSAVLVIFHFIKSRLPRSIFYFIIHFLFLFVLLRYWRGEKSFGYLQFFHPYIIIFLGYLIYWLLDRFKKYYAGLSITIIFFAYMAIVSGFPLFSRDSNHIHLENMVKLLYKKYPEDKFVLYRCNNIQDSSYDLILKLDMDGKYSFNGRKLFLTTTSCSLPSTFSKAVKIDKNNFGILYDINKISGIELVNSNWNILSPEAVYEDVARWWFKLKP